MFTYAARRTDEHKLVSFPLELPLNHRSSGTPHLLSLLSLTVLKICPSFWDWSQDKVRLHVSAKVSDSFLSLWQFCGTDVGQSSKGVPVAPSLFPQPTHLKRDGAPQPFTIIELPQWNRALLQHDLQMSDATLFLLIFNNNHLLWNCFNISHIEPFRLHLIHHI